MDPDAVGMVQDRGLDPAGRGPVFLDIDGPRVHIRSCDSRQPAGGVARTRGRIVLDRPVHRIARKSVLALNV